MVDFNNEERRLNGQSHDPKRVRTARFDEMVALKLDLLKRNFADAGSRFTEYTGSNHVSQRLHISAGKYKPNSLRVEYCKGFIKRSQ